MNDNEVPSRLKEARQAAFQLQLELRAASTAGSVVPDAHTLDRLEAEWLPEGLVRCRITPACTGSCQQHRRCEASYWRAHHRKVRTLLGDFAKVLGVNPTLYRVAGFVYDMDYLKFPHDLCDGPLTEAHPFPIVRALIQLHAPPQLCLAVLEHAPHLPLPASGPLSLALNACGDIVTLAAADVDLPWPTDLPPAWIACLKTASRGGLQDGAVTSGRFIRRALPALRELATTLGDGYEI